MIIQIQISRQNRFSGKFEYWKSKLFLPSHIFFWLRMSKEVTFDIFLLSKKRNVSSPELCDICATCFVSTKYNINSFFNFNQHDSFFSDQIAKQVFLVATVWDDKNQVLRFAQIWQITFKSTSCDFKTSKCIFFK